MLTPEELNQLQQITLDQLKEDGLHDEVRREMFNQIWDHPHFKTTIVNQFKQECETFCQDESFRKKLSQNRNVLRKEMTNRFEQKYSRSSVQVDRQLEKEMEEKSDHIKNTFYRAARKFLIEKFIDKANEVRDGQSVDMEIESDHEDNLEPSADHVDQKNDLNTNLTNNKSDRHDMADDIENHSDDRVDIQPENHDDYHEDITPPRWSPIVQDKCDQATDDIANSQESMNISPITDIDSPRNPADDALEHLAFSDVSSVRTNDLDDFEDTIKLSDDEADFIGKPKDKHVKISVIVDELERNHNISSRLTPATTPKHEPVNNVKDPPKPVSSAMKNDQDTEAASGNSQPGPHFSNVDSPSIDSLATTKTRTRSIKLNSKYHNDSYQTNFQKTK